MKQKEARSSLISLDGVFIKQEYLNPSGSVKDRIAEYIVDKAERSGKLKKGYTIIEATSGNTGIAFSRVAALRRYKMIAVMPKGMSVERTKIMKAYGAKIVNVKKGDFLGAIAKAKHLGKKSKTYLPLQFENQWNAEEHEKHLGPELVRQMGNKKIDAFVAGVGTGGTVIGVGKAIKKHFPKAKVFALEPDECHLLASSCVGNVFGPISKGNICKHHDIEGIGDGIVPDIVRKNKDVLDGIVEIKSSLALKKARELARRGFFVGPSSGANLLGALRLKKKFKNVVTLFCDSGDRYLSENIYN